MHREYLDCTVMAWEGSVLLPTWVLQDLRILISTLMTNISAWLCLNHLSDCIWTRSDCSPLSKVCNTIMLGKKGVTLKYLSNSFRDLHLWKYSTSASRSKKDFIAFAVCGVSNCVYGEGSASLRGGQASLHCSLFFSWQKCLLL